MRITINIDDDLMREIKKRALNKDKSLTNVINHAIRKGIEQGEGQQDLPAYQCPEFSLGTNQHYNLDKALEIANSLEDEVYPSIRQ